MDKQHRETIRLLVSKARALVIETQDAKRGSPQRNSERLEASARPSRARPGMRTDSKERIESRPNEVSRYSPFRYVPVRSQKMPSFEYRYELRQNEALIATGHIARSEAVEVGEQIVIGGLSGIVRTIEPPHGELGSLLVI